MVCTARRQQMKTNRLRHGLFSPAGRRCRQADEGAEGMTDITKRRPGKTEQARQLRQNETDAEYRLWGDLRNRLLNSHKFTRQVPLGPYIADFVCRERYLVVELDGSQHAESASDEIRTAWLNDQGYDVLRFWNDEVRTGRHEVLATILAVLEGEITERCNTLRFYPGKRG
ncbi:endonuclease domain-containing protein [Allorhizobium terrae]|uniref:Endonuclease domain-containing protein n=2 Tax=Allorhizobium terrae TaxID=1848972 RepID=A0A4S4A739_9HYPH|nr:endonuclease domain-containing protein [Allorhizobium terrae]